MTDWAKVLRAVCPRGKASIITGFAAAMPDAIDTADLSTPLRQAHFIAQCCHESANLAVTVEYASGRAYEGRHDLGNVHAGDGVRYKGRGLIQLTGRANYAHAGAELGVGLVDNPEAAAAFPAAAQTAALYWRDRHINRFADADDVRGATRAVNGGLNGLESRAAYLAKAKRALGVASAAGFLSAGDDTAAPESPSPDIAAAQRRLKSLGYFPGEPDGDAGPATTGALAAFQKEQGLPVSGDLDPATTAALGSAMACAHQAAPSRATATEDDLRAKGSDTIDAADDAEDGAKKGGMGALVAASGGIVAAGKAAADQAQTVQDTFAQARGLLPWLQAHWLLIALVIILAGASYAVWHAAQTRQAARKIRRHRVNDHRSGAHMGR